MDKVWVFAFEMAVIHLASQTAKQLNEHQPVAIFSDSLSAVRCIKNEYSASRPKILQEIWKTKHELNRDTKLVWVPTTEPHWN